MSASPEPPTRILVADTETPAAEIFVIDGNGSVVARAVNRLEQALVPALYKLRFRVGDRVTDLLMELPPGDGPFQVETPRLPFETPAPITRRSQSPNLHAATARELSLSTPDDHGSGSRLLLLLDAAAPQGHSKVQLRRFTGQLVVEVGGEAPSVPFAGCHVALDPGAYLLRSGELEQTIVTSEGWQTQVYIPLNGEEPGEQADLSAAAVLMSRFESGFDPDDPGFRWAEVARQALAAGRNATTRDPALMQALVSEKFENPMLGLLAAHLMLQAAPIDQDLLDQDLLKEVVRNLGKLIPNHPDLTSVWYRLKDARANDLSFPVPPMLRSSWQQIVFASTPERDPVGQGSYSARMAANLWGGGAWLTWTTPSPAETTVASANGPRDLASFLARVAAGKFALDAVAPVDLSPAERALISYAESLLGQVDLARTITTVIDKSKALSALYPALRLFKSSDIEKGATRLLASTRSPEEIRGLTGLPLASLGDAAASLMHKIAAQEQPSPLSSVLSGVASIGSKAFTAAFR